MVLICNSQSHVEAYWYYGMRCDMTGIMKFLTGMFKRNGSASSSEVSPRIPFQGYRCAFHLNAIVSIVLGFVKLNASIPPLCVSQNHILEAKRKATHILPNAK